MSVLVGSESRVLVQGITGGEGSFHASQMIEYGTNVVGGVVPGKGGQTALDVPVFDTMAEAVKETGGNVSVIFVPAAFAAAACRSSWGGSTRRFYRTRPCSTPTRWWPVTRKGFGHK